MGEKRLNKKRVALKWVLSRTEMGRAFLIKRALRRNAFGTHPFDAANNVQTSGAIPQYLLSPKQSMRTISRNETHPYFGCSPNCLRAALDQMEDLAGTTFVDFGCGMGRAAIIASEYPFQSVIGVEISKDLSAIARRNARTIRKSFPNRCGIEIINQDARSFHIDDTNLVIFIYNPFGPDLIKIIMMRLESIIQAGYSVHIIYQNPVYFNILDEFDAFERYFGGQIKCDPAERPQMFDNDDAIVVWRPKSATYPANDKFDIRVITAGTRAELVF
ncbi:MAG: class I SAM-dependent methyltransferase [Microvirga sp.]